MKDTNQLTHYPSPEARKIFDSYHDKHALLDDLEKATFAYHWTPVDHPNAHQLSKIPEHVLKNSYPLPSSVINEACKHCGRTRSEIRWDTLPAHCANIGRHTISDVIYAEEVKFIDLLNSAETRIPDVLASRFNGRLDAQALFYLQSSEGFPPDVVATYYDEREIEKMMPEFEALMRAHKQKSGNSFKSRNTGTY